MLTRLALLLCAVFMSVSTSAVAQDAAKIGFIYIGPVGESGWSFEHERARLAVVEEFGDRVETEYFELVQEGEQAKTLMRDLAQKGFDLIFATSFSYMNDAVEVAFEYPGLKIEHATGYVRTKNISTYSGRFYEGRVSQGILAGHMTKANRIGYIASHPIPEVVRGINATFLAARTVNPDIEFDIVWTNSWFNPDLEGKLARQLLADGADILIQHTDSAAPTLVAQELGEFSFGQDSDMREFGPDSSLSALINNWGPYYISRVEALLNGTWESQDVWDGLSQNMVEIGAYSDLIPLRFQRQADDANERIKSGQLHAFTGPIRKQDGSGWLASGETATDRELLTMDFYVEGLKGSIPK